MNSNGLMLQRAAILDKGRESDPDDRPPNLLMMSATPIPRTLALSVFGDLDVSVIKTMPPGRKPVITHLAAKKNEERVYDFIRRELAAGNQAYFVYPLIDPSDSVELASATDMFTHLRERVFPIPLRAHSLADSEDEQRGTMHVPVRKDKDPCGDKCCGSWRMYRTRPAWLLSMQNGSVFRHFTSSAAVWAVEARSHTVFSFFRTSLPKPGKRACGSCTKPQTVS